MGGFRSCAVRSINIGHVGVRVERGARDCVAMHVLPLVDLVVDLVVVGNLEPVLVVNLVTDAQVTLRLFVHIHRQLI